MRALGYANPLRGFANRENVIGQSTPWVVGLCGRQGKNEGKGTRDLGWISLWRLYATGIERVEGGYTPPRWTEAMEGIR